MLTSYAKQSAGKFPKKSRIAKATAELE